ncbi:hypothetical protein HPB52_005284 [Rhipicephalus sanguineus]|uniref:Uncharacterized protein n=1 Tax=Rhipicephalus sanguineus TaxID=34632 RepID=A0A9D4SVW7_RHISA|nr:hypothetical protein HPB52_005284 [Rhipicephalus sanguineus]
MAVATRLMRRCWEREGQYIRLVVFYAGLRGSLKGSQSDDAVQVLRDQLVSPTPGLVICSVPESETYRKGAHARVVLLKARLKQLCTTWNPEFLNASKVLEGKGGLVKEKNLYTNEASTLIAAEIAKVLFFRSKACTLSQTRPSPAHQHRAECTDADTRSEGPASYAGWNKTSRSGTGLPSRNDSTALSGAHCDTGDKSTASCRTGSPTRRPCPRLLLRNDSASAGAQPPARRNSTGIRASAPTVGGTKNGDSTSPIPCQQPYMPPPPTVQQAPLHPRS